MKLNLSSALAALSILAASLPALGANPVQPKVYIDAEPSFATALTAAIEKKNVPVTVVVDPKQADFTLKSAPVASKDESGAGKIARCLFADCIGMNGNSSVSVELLRSSDSSVVWAYQVRKGNSGPLGIQSLSEAIAKHLKNDYLAKHSN
jgi:hypothetical protein